MVFTTPASQEMEELIAEAKAKLDSRYRCSNLRFGQDQISCETNSVMNEF